MLKSWNRFWMKAVSIGVAGSMCLATPVMAATGNTAHAGISSVLAGETQEAAAQTVETAAAETAESAAAAADGLLVSGIAQVKKTSEGMLNARKVVSTTKYEKTEEDKAESRELAEEIDQQAEEEESVSPYENIAIAQTISNVNIRDEASENGDVVGKIYNNAAATIVDVVEKEDGRWYKIKSGAVEGYTKSDYFVTGEEAEAIAYEVGDVKATVYPETLRLRSEADTDSSVITLLSAEEKYDVISQEDGFAKIRIDDDVTGYVASNYVTFSVDFEKAVTIEEVREAIEAQERAEREAREAEEAEARAAAEAEEEEEPEESYEEEDEEDEEPAPEYDEDDEDEDEDEDEEESSDDSDDEEEEEEEDDEDEEVIEDDDEEEEVEQVAEEEEEEDEDDEDDDDDSYSGTRDAIVDYALSFVGNVPYVYGGTSLSSGVDCSGFVQAVFGHFGISLPRTSDSQGGCGRSVSSSNKQPGDIIYYGGHVGIYIGGGEVVHASNERSGIKVSSWNYRGVASIRNVID